MAEDPRNWEPETQAVRGGLMRTPHGEISEALFLTQSFAYDSAQAADDRFAGGPGFIYQRFGNPTTQMFEDRLALMEGAEQCKATASGIMRPPLHFPSTTTSAGRAIATGAPVPAMTEIA